MPTPGRSVTTIIVRFNSHRARERVIGRDGTAAAYWSWSKPAKGGYYRVPAEMLPLIRKVAGATVARDPGDLCRCC